MLQKQIYCLLAIILTLDVMCNLSCTSRRVCDGMYPRLDAQKAGKAAITQYDANGDGKLDEIELCKSPGVKAALSKLDTTGCGFVTANMIAERIKQWQTSRVGKMPIVCVVMLNGKPLDGAKVEFVPESFLNKMLLAKAMDTAVGDTNEKGEATISVPVTDTPNAVTGVPPGFYSVKIIKSGSNIPDKYNKKTTIGVEVAIDSSGLYRDENNKMKYYVDICSSEGDRKK